jgi:hypothetical protein
LVARQVPTLGDCPEQTSLLFGHQGEDEEPARHQEDLDNQAHPEAEKADHGVGSEPPLGNLPVDQRQQPGQMGRQQSNRDHQIVESPKDQKGEQVSQHEKERGKSPDLPPKLTDGKHQQPIHTTLMSQNKPG